MARRYSQPLSMTVRLPGSKEAREALLRLLSEDWSEHIDAVRPAIKALDRKDAESQTRAPFIAVSDETDH